MAPRVTATRPHRIAAALAATLLLAACAPPEPPDSVTPTVTGTVRAPLGARLFCRDNPEHHRCR